MCNNERLPATRAAFFALEIKSEEQAFVPRAFRTVLLSWFIWCLMRCEVSGRGELLNVSHVQGSCAKQIVSEWLLHTAMDRFQGITMNS